jgi:transcriptional regulator GlxA family with amidase domain
MAIQEQKTVAFVLYPGLTLLDLVGPLQVFASLRRFNDHYRPVVVAERIEPMPTDGPLTVTADHTFGDVPDPAVVIVPGGDAPTIKAMGNQAIRDYLHHAADTAPVVGSVCTGALVLAAAGLLEGRQATTHWAYHRLLERLGATYLPHRWVEDGKLNCIVPVLGVPPLARMSRQLGRVDSLANARGGGRALDCNLLRGLGVLARNPGM